MEYTPVKSINQKSAGIDPKDAIRTKAPVKMVTIFGVVTSVKLFEDKRSGDLKTKFIGEFRATSPDGTKGYQSDVLYCFRALEEKLSSVHAAGDNKPVEFAYEIVASPDDKSATGYGYAAKTLIATASSDRLNAIEAQLQKLAAPAAPESPAPGIPASNAAEAEAKTKAAKK